jgi:MurNAc alpha-1-phosphate uridylyltransferase
MSPAPTTAPQTAPKTAMVLAAGLGTRMRPLTNDRPKALVEVAGRALIDHVLDRLADAGVERAVVNVHWFADRLERRLAERGRGPAITISDERAELLETGGGLKKAGPLLGADPVFVANIDSVWTDRGDALDQLARLWNPSIMDAALLLARREGSIGFEGDGDFFLDEEGRLTFRGDAPSAPYAYMGVHICRPDYVADGPDGPFSLSGFWRRSAAAGRLYGCVLDGDWMHVGDPQARDEAEAKLAGGGRSG